MGKACDLCYLRKIKCDGQKPRCSHCIIYRMDCTYAAPSRQAKPKKLRGSAKIEEDNLELQKRVGRLEALLERLASSRNDENENEHGVQNRLQTSKPRSEMELSTTVSNEGENVDCRHGSTKYMDLPSLRHILTVTHVFLEKFNSVLPLFHDQTLLRLIHDYYEAKHKDRNPIVWAAINVVMALTHRQGLLGGGKTDHSVEYLSNAQSVLSKVVLHDIELLNIQVLVGMVMLIQNSQDVQPALILIGTTMRLAHKIGLHNRASSVELDPVLARQRAYVFWIAYILDKDICLRSKQPSVQVDDDIDLDLPQSKVKERWIDDEVKFGDSSMGVGIIAADDKTVSMNYFVTRIQLAVIEGGVYDYLYSTSAQKRSPEERSHALQSVAHALEQWQTSIPSELKGIEASRRVSPDMLQFLFELEGTSLLCTTCINQAHAWNDEWVTSLRRCSIEGTTPLMPLQWEELVDEARDLMVLFRQREIVNRRKFW